MGVGALPLNQRDGLRIGPAIAFLTPEVRARPNLRIVPLTRCAAISLDGRARRASWPRRPDGSTTRYEAGEVILAAGAVVSPQLLLLAGIGPRPTCEPWASRSSRTCRASASACGTTPRRGRSGGCATASGWSADVPWLQLSARYTATGSDLRGDMMLYPNSVVPGDDPGSVDFRIEAVNNLQLSAGRLWLRSADPTVKPAIDLRLLAEPRDRARLADAVHRSIALGRDSAAARTARRTGCCPRTTTWPATPRWTPISTGR